MYNNAGVNMQYYSPYYLHLPFVLDKKLINFIKEIQTFSYIDDCDDTTPIRKYSNLLFDTKFIDNSIYYQTEAASSLKSINSKKKIWRVFRNQISRMFRFKFLKKKSTLNSKDTSPLNSDSNIDAYYLKKMLTDCDIFLQNKSYLLNKSFNDNFSKRKSHILKKSNIMSIFYRIFKRPKEEVNIENNNFNITNYAKSIIDNWNDTYILLDDSISNKKHLTSEEINSVKQVFDLQSFHNFKNYNDESSNNIIIHEKESINKLKNLESSINSDENIYLKTILLLLKRINDLQLFSKKYLEANKIINLENELGNVSLEKNLQKNINKKFNDISEYEVKILIDIDQSNSVNFLNQKQNHTLSYDNNFVLEYALKILSNPVNALNDKYLMLKNKNSSVNLEDNLDKNFFTKVKNKDNLNNFFFEEHIDEIENLTGSNVESQVNDKESNKVDELEKIDETSSENFLFNFVDVINNDADDYESEDENPIVNEDPFNEHWNNFHWNGQERPSIVDMGYDDTPKSFWNNDIWNSNKYNVGTSWHDLINMYATSPSDLHTSYDPGEIIEDDENLTTHWNLSDWNASDQWLSVTINDIVEDVC